MKIQPLHGVHILFTYTFNQPIWSIAISTKKQRNFSEYSFINDQCYPYEALGCDFSKEGFKGALFRLLLRTRMMAKQSEISTQEIDINYISVMHLNLVTFDLQIPIWVKEDVWYLSAIEIIDTQVARRGRQYHRNPPSYKQ